MRDGEKKHGDVDFKVLVARSYDYYQLLITSITRGGIYRRMNCNFNFEASLMVNDDCSEVIKAA
jgi:hypothetical protein